MANDFNIFDWIRAVNGSAISIQARGLALLLVDYINKQGVCWPSRETLSERSGSHFRSIRRWVTELEDAGLLERISLTNLRALVPEEGDKSVRQEDTGVRQEDKSVRVEGDKSVRGEDKYVRQEDKYVREGDKSVRKNQPLEPTIRTSQFEQSLAGDSLLLDLFDSHGRTTSQPVIHELIASAATLGATAVELSQTAQDVLSDVPRASTPKVMTYIIERLTDAAVARGSISQNTFREDSETTRELTDEEAEACIPF